MSWNNQGGGPWQSKGQGPWGSGPGGAPTPNDIEDAIRRLQKNFKGLPGGGLAARGRSWRSALVLVLLWLGLGVFYTVQPNEVALNLVFGRYTGRLAAGPQRELAVAGRLGHQDPVQDQQITEVGYRADGGDVPSESLMLTGDKNIVHVHFRVNWRIDAAHPEDFVFNVLNPRETVKSVAESIMREVVGQKTIDGILTSDRNTIEPDVHDRMQKVLDGYKIGVLRRAGAVAVGRRAAAGGLRLSRRDRGAAGSAARRQRSRDLRQPGQCPRPRAAPRASSRRPRPISSRRCSTPRARPPATIQVYEQYKNAPRRDARAHVSGDDGEACSAACRRRMLDASVGAPRRCPISPLEPQRQAPGAVK